MVANKPIERKHILRLDQLVSIGAFLFSTTSMVSRESARVPTFPRENVFGGQPRCRIRVVCAAWWIFVAVVNRVCADRRHHSWRKWSVKKKKRTITHSFWRISKADFLDSGAAGEKTVGDASNKEIYLDEERFSEAYQFGCLLPPLLVWRNASLG